jgi:putative ABC transport system substrate-binding protein
MGPRLLVLAVVLGVATLPLAASAQPGRAPRRVGILCTFACPTVPVEVNVAGQSLLEGLRDAGFVDGVNVVLDHRGSVGTPEDVPRRAADLVRRKVDVILAVGDGTEARAAKRATATIPIVLAGIADAVQSGLVASQRRPGGNVTGITIPVRQLAAKQLELLKEALPGLARVVVLSNPGNPQHRPALDELDAAAQVLRVKLQPLAAWRPDDFEAALRTLRKDGSDALLVLPDPTFGMFGRLPSLALNARVPTMFGSRAAVEGAGLMSFAPDPGDLYRTAGILIGKILNGARPADLPVEEPRRFELVVNLTTARAIGVTISQSILVRADAVIQ